MASHAHHPGDPISAVKKGGIAAVLIATVGSIVVAVVNMISSVDTAELKASKGPPPPTAAPPPTTTNLPNGAPDTALRFSPLTNGKLTVSGSAPKDVIAIYVEIGPKSSSGGYDTGCGNVVNQRWQAEVPTDASWPNYPLVTIPAYVSSCVGATSASALKFTFQETGPTTPPPPPPDQILDCAKQNGPSCFNGPGFGPPTTYQPNQ
jgi:hypothetical protein